jgi:hypothetical protein
LRERADDRSLFDEDVARRSEQRGTTCHRRNAEHGERGRPPDDPIDRIHHTPPSIS